MELVIPIEGEPTKVIRKKVNVKQLVLDTDNPRIQYHIDSSLNENLSQDEIKNILALSNEQYDKLKESIENNGGVVNPIWVLPQGSYFKVIEGNSRALVYQELLDKNPLKDCWKNIDAYIFPKDINRNKINFIRLEAHLFGTTPWDAYEKARELYRLHTEEDYSEKRLSMITKMSEKEIKDMIVAFKTMTESYLPKYRQPGELLKFSYFVELHKNKGLKELIKKGEMTIQEFCDLVGKRRLSRGEDVRKLADVWVDPMSKELLLRDGFKAALDQLSVINPAVTSKLFENIEKVNDQISQMPMNEWLEIKEGYHQKKVDLLIELYIKVKKLLTDIGINYENK